MAADEAGKGKNGFFTVTEQQLCYASFF